ncbi:MAG: glycoside hydrolase family 13 protein [Oscillospiraceae bacterium]
MQVYDSWNPAFKSKFGAISVGETCEFSLRLPNEIHYDLPPILVMFQPEKPEHFLALNIKSKAEKFTEYSVTYTAKNVGVHYYYFKFSCGANRYFVKKIGPHDGIIGEGGLFQLTIFDNNFKTPDFFKGGIVYQIFPDRFFKSGIAHENVPSDRVLHENWGETPLYKPDENGHVWNNDYFGGDLAGIAEKLPFLASLGVTCIYLNPIFEAHENHRYNTADYLKIDSLLGTNSDFETLCFEAKKRGISIILDGVFNHTGADSVYFNKFNRYATLGAYNSEKSPYFNWYSFSKFPEKYSSWWGISTLPDVNETNPDYLEFICGENGVLRYWLNLGAAGFRLDVADELPDEFLDKLNRSIKSSDAEKLIIGEVWEDASNKESYGVRRRYLIGGELDSVMNYPFRDAIIGYILGMNAREFQDRILTILENYPKPSIDCLLNFVSTHDIQRAINVLGSGDCSNKDRDWQAAHKLSAEEYSLGKNRLKCAMVLQFFLPGVPSIYYGDEAGLDGDKDPFNRKCYPWGSEDLELIEFTKELSKIRKSTDIFKEGKLKFLSADNDVISFSRYDSDKTRAILIMLNKGSSPRYFMEDLDIISHYSSYELIRGTSTDQRIKLLPYDFAVAKVEMNRKNDMD